MASDAQVMQCIVTIKQCLKKDVLAVWAVAWKRAEWQKQRQMDIVTTVAGMSKPRDVA